MAEPTIAGDVLAPAWDALTDDQRSCWHFFAQTHPIVNAQGDLRTINGWQMYYRVNVYLAVAEYDPLISDPPQNLTPPSTRTVAATLWRNNYSDEFGATQRQPLLTLAFRKPTPSSILQIVQQGYTTNKAGTPIPLHPTKTRPASVPSPRHVTIIPPGFSGLLDLRTPTGYFASTGGRPKFSTISGTSAAKNSKRPAATLLVVSTVNGAVTRGTFRTNTETHTAQKISLR